MKTITLILSFIKILPLTLLALIDWLIAGLQNVLLPIAQVTPTDKDNEFVISAVSKLEDLRDKVLVGALWVKNLGL